MRKHFCTGDTRDVSTPSLIQTVMMPGSVDYHKLHANFVPFWFLHSIDLSLKILWFSFHMVFICVCFIFFMSEKTVKFLLRVGIPYYSFSLLGNILM